MIIFKNVEYDSLGGFQLTNPKVLATVEIQTEEVGINDIIARFEDFLRASGFNFQGHLELVNDLDICDDEPDICDDDK